jgi:NAD-dependent deacetylase
MRKNIVVLSGAGISAESGIETFRDADGLWQGHDVMAVASPEGWREDPNLVLEFYNKRRYELLNVNPNIAHQTLVMLEKSFNVTIVTQNVDDLHERAGSSNVLHLHGELLKAQSTQNIDLIYPCLEDISLGDSCELGSQLRPYIVWFGEEVPKLNDAILQVSKADIIIIIGTSMQVYPAAGLISFVPKDTPIYYIDPSPAVNDALECADNVTLIKKNASQGVVDLAKKLSVIHVV